MRFLLWSTIRFLGYGLLSFTVLAIIVGGMEQPQHATRILRTCVPLVVHGYLFSPRVHEPLFLDPQTGKTQRLALPAGDQVDQISFAPWRNDLGESQVVGRWASGDGKNQDRVTVDVGLARYTFPGGQLVDRITSEVVPSSPICWFPDASDRVLFAAADGQLYRLTFRSENENESRRPVPLSWLTERPGGGSMFVDDPAWPADPRFGGRLFVALSYVNVEDGRRKYTPQQVWCLRLNPGASAVVDAVRLTGIGPDTADRESRCPSLTITPSGVAVLACLSRQARRGPILWELELTEIVLDHTKHRMPELTRSTRILADHCLPVAPTFSEDGRWVTCVERGPNGQPQARRIAVGDMPGEAGSVVRSDESSTPRALDVSDLSTHS